MVRDIIRGKVVIVGDSKVGKTSLINKFLHSDEPMNNLYQMTIEANLESVTINIPDTNFAVELQLIDLGGHKLFMETRRELMLNITYVIAAYNIIDRQSFDSLKDWLDELKSAQTQKPFEIKGILLGCKSDLIKHTAISPQVIIY